MTNEEAPADAPDALVIALTPIQAIAVVAVFVAIFLLIRARRAE